MITTSAGATFFSLTIRFHRISATSTWIGASRLILKSPVAIPTQPGPKSSHSSRYFSSVSARRGVV